MRVRLTSGYGVSVFWAKDFDPLPLFRFKNRLNSLESHFLYQIKQRIGNGCALCGIGCWPMSLVWASFGPLLHS